MENGEIDGEYVEAFGYLLALNVDLSYKAHLLELPTISMFMLRQECVDFEKLCDAKEKLEVDLATRYKGELLRLYREHHNPKGTRDTNAIAQRTLKNRALQLLSALDDQEITELAKKQYDDAQTMSDRLSALSLLYNHGGVMADEALQHFYTTYKDDSLTINKYFAIVASSKNSDTLQRVMALEEDEVYDTKVPNMVRALLGSFTRNYRYFHAKDGSGYRFLAKKILELDTMNPQVASSLAGAFKIYKKINSANKNVIKGELECVVSTQSLSKNTFEIIDKILH
jgi:aminopeptidase N